MENIFLNPSRGFNLSSFGDNWSPAKTKPVCKDSAIMAARKVTAKIGISASAKDLNPIARIYAAKPSENSFADAGICEKIP